MRTRRSRSPSGSRSSRWSSCSATTGVITINPQAIAQSMTYVLVGLASLYFVYIFFAGGLTGDEKKRIGRDRRAVRFRGDLLVGVRAGADVAQPVRAGLHRSQLVRLRGPATWLQSVNSVFVIIFAPVFALIWSGARETRARPVEPGEVRVRPVLRRPRLPPHGLAANIVVAAAATVKVSMWWLVGSYFLQTLGELSLSPVGLSLDDQARAAQDTSAR